MNTSAVLAVVLGLALIGAIAALVFTELKPGLSHGRKTPRPAPATVTGREALDSIDLGLRKLSAEFQRLGRPLPDVYAVSYSGDELTLRLADPDVEAPAPWTADAEGDTWSVEPAALNGTSAADAAHAAHPYSLAVTVGLDQGERLLVDLSRASAPIAVIGDSRGVRELVGAFVNELITGPVGRHAEVTLVGSAATVELTSALGLRSARLRTVATLQEGLDWGTDPSQSAGAGALDSSVTQPFRMITGTGAATKRGRVPRLFVVDATQFADEKRAMAGLRATDALVLIGDSQEAGWWFVVAPDGSLEARPLDLRVDPHAGRMS
ncbi:hypothetical protein ACWD5V_17075 [Streptomyces sp. NPDC002523]